MREAFEHYEQTFESNVGLRGSVSEPDRYVNVHVQGRWVRFTVGWDAALAALNGQANVNGQKTPNVLYTKRSSDLIKIKEWRVGEAVEKLRATIARRARSVPVFTMKDGTVRYVVEHKAEGGSFCHIYSAQNLRSVYGG